MSTTTITSEINDLTGASIPNVKVTARLLPRPCYETATGVALTSLISTTSDANGQWSLALTRTADITPANSRYEITEYVPDRYGGPVKSIIQVGAVTATLLASLVTQPTAPTADVALTQAAADARYVQSPGSFAVVGNVSDSRPADAAAAGVLTTYSRGDHKHSRELIRDTAANIAALTGVNLITGHPYVTSNAANITGTGIATPDTVSQPARADGLWVRNGTRFQPGYWNQPWGIMGLVQVTASPAAFTNVKTDIAGMSITFTAAANRRYKLSLFASCLLSASASNEEYYIHFSDSANVDYQQVRFIASLNTKNAPSVQGWVVVTPAAGAVTYKLRSQTLSGTVTVNATSTAPFQFLIEDIGPNGAPA